MEEVPSDDGSETAAETVPAAVDEEQLEVAGEDVPLEEKEAEPLDPDVAEQIRELMGGPAPQESGDGLDDGFEADFAMRTEALPDAAEEEDEPAQKSSGGRVFLAVLITPFMIALALVGIALSAALSCIGLAPGAGLAAASTYLAMYSTASMSYLPDMLIVLGVCLLCLALTLFFLWLGIWFLFSGIALTFRVIRSAYRGVLGKGGSKR